MVSFSAIFKSPLPLSDINVRNRKPVPDFWEFFYVLEYIFKQLKESIKDIFLKL